MTAVDSSIREIVREEVLIALRECPVVCEPEPEKPDATVYADGCSHPYASACAEPETVARPFVEDQDIARAQVVDTLTDALRLAVSHGLTELQVSIEAEILRLLG